MRLIDLIEDMEATSRRLAQRPGLDAGGIARITADTLVRRDLSRYLQASIGEALSDPAERLCAMLLRMSEIIRGPAPACAFYEGFTSGALRPAGLGLRSYAVHHHLGPGGPAVGERRSASLKAAAEGDLGALDHLAAFSHEGTVLETLAEALRGREVYRATSALLVGPSPALQGARAAWAGSRTVEFSGPMLHFGQGRTYDCLYSVPSDRRDLNL